MCLGREEQGRVKGGKWQDMRKERFLSISEFAKISDVSRKKLIFYDNIGLFKPALVKPNGYRCYAHWQIEVITVISVLSELGIPLEKIKQYLHQYGPEQALAMFREQTQVIERKIENLRSIQEMLRMRICTIQEGMQAGLDFRVVEQEEIPMYLSEPFHYDTNEMPDELWERLYRSCEQHGISFCYPVCYIITYEDLLAGDYHMVSRLCFRMADMEKANGAMPSGHYLVGYRNYHYGDTYPMYEQMCRYAKEHRLKIGGDAYEEYILDELATSRCEDYKVKLSIRLEG